MSAVTQAYVNMTVEEWQHEISRCGCQVTHTRREVEAKLDELVARVPELASPSASIRRAFDEMEVANPDLVPWMAAHQVHYLESQTLRLQAEGVYDMASYRCSRSFQ